MHLRRNSWPTTALSEELSNYTLKHEQPQVWTLGNSPHYAGFHCSWCYRPEGIRTKLASAQRHDKPRWGDYPQKMEISYIESLVRDGQWFDGTYPFIRVNRYDCRRISCL